MLFINKSIFIRINIYLNKVIKYTSVFIIVFSNQSFASERIEQAGDVLQYLIPAVTYGSTFWLNDPEGRMEFYKSFAANILVTQSLKSIINKERPNGSYRSFPSGHTSVAFQGAAFIHKRYGFTSSIPAYIGATFVGYSRVESDNHHVEDVLAGAAIGMAISFYFTQSGNGVNFLPFANRGSYGFLVSMAF